MKYLGNIITDGKFDDTILYNVVKTKDKIIEGIPTLIIGYSKTKTIYDKFSILDWKIEDNVYWSYGRRERGERYFETIDKFKDLCFKIMLDTVKYNLFNVIIETTENKHKFFDFLKSDVEKTVFINNDMVYIYYNNKHVTGFSLRDIDYIGGNRKKVLSKVLSPNNKIINSKDIFNEKFVQRLKNKPYVVPYLYS